MDYLLADEALLERMVRAVTRVRDRMRKAATALNRVGAPYAVVGDHAVAAWVGSIEEGAVRNPQNVEIILRREDLLTATKALEVDGFVSEPAVGATAFLDGPNAKARDAVFLLFADEVMPSEHSESVPIVENTSVIDGVHFLALESLVRMKLATNRRHDRVHIRDMIDVGLIDASWCAKLPAELAARLQVLLDTPDG